MAVLHKQGHFVVIDLIQHFMSGNIVYGIMSNPVLAASTDRLPATDALVSLDRTGQSHRKRCARWSWYCVPGEILLNLTFLV